MAKNHEKRSRHILLRLASARAGISSCRFVGGSYGRDAGPMLESIGRGRERERERGRIKQLLPLLTAPDSTSRLRGYRYVRLMWRYERNRLILALAYRSGSSRRCTFCVLVQHIYQPVQRAPAVFGSGTRADTHTEGQVRLGKHRGPIKQNDV